MRLRENIRSISQLPSALRRVVQESLYRDYSQDFVKSLDEEVSTCYVKDNQVMVGFLVTSQDNTYFSECIYRSESYRPVETIQSSEGVPGSSVYGEETLRIISYLVYASLAGAYRKSSDEGILFMKLGRHTDAPIVDQFFNSADTIEMETYRAPVDERFRDASRLKEEIEMDRETSQRLMDFPKYAEVVEVEYLSGI